LKILQTTNVVLQSRFVLAQIVAALILNEVGDGLSFFNQLCSCEAGEAPVIVSIPEWLIVWDSRLHLGNERLQLCLDCF